MRRPIAILIVVLLTLSAAGCIALAEEAFLAGGLEVAAAEAVTAGVAEVAMAEGLAMRGAAGFMLRASAVEGLEIAATEEAIASSSLRVGIGELAGRPGLRLVRASSGALSVAEGRLGFDRVGRLTITDASRVTRTVGEISEGKIWEVDAAGRQVRPTGIIRARPLNADVRLRAEPSTDAKVLATLKPGSLLDVVRLRDGWFEVIVREQRGWVSAPALQLLTASMLAGFHFTMADSIAADGSPNRVAVQAFDALGSALNARLQLPMSTIGQQNADRLCGGDAMSCLTRSYEAGTRRMQTHTGDLSVRSVARTAFTTWEDSALAVVVLRTYWNARPPQNVLCQTFDLDRSESGWNIRYFDVPMPCQRIAEGRPLGRLAVTVGGLPLRAYPSHDAPAVLRLAAGDVVSAIDSATYGTMLPHGAIALESILAAAGGERITIDAGEPLVVLTESPTGALVSYIANGSERIVRLPTGARLDKRAAPLESWVRVLARGKRGFVPARYLSSRG